MGLIGRGLGRGNRGNCAKEGGEGGGLRTSGLLFSKTVTGL